ncbi:hypothetical protein ACFU44_13725 [Nocardia rhizosphaerihabitans]|uniref:hypothetical protein n=1 Tax=Nocardia rhizosphaerihabitans TaxID=1691570 RepID=UPI00367133F2
MTIAQQTSTVNDKALTSVLPVPGRNAEPVDYDKIDQTITEKIVGLSPPAEPPVPPTVQEVDYPLISSFVTEAVKHEVAQLPKPKDGEKGKDGIANVPEMRIHPVSRELEWRCVGDTLWTVLATSPILEDGCV